jgi:precorrin-2/cobalt-factor-2 C20-methyltransferase
LKVIGGADVVFIPISSKDRGSVAGDIYSKLNAERKTYPFLFPMTSDREERDAGILSQLGEYASLLRDIRSVALPVLGDSALYATAAYLFSAWKSVCPELELKLVPGISAHSLASCVAGEFMALGEECAAILPGSAEFSRLAAAMSASDCVALYKPSALKDKLPELIEVTGPWSRAVRVHRAGLEEQRVVFGGEACAPTGDYLSVLLLWRNRN